MLDLLDDCSGKTSVGKMLVPFLEGHRPTLLRARQAQGGDISEEEVVDTQALSRHHP